MLNLFLLFRSLIVFTLFRFIMSQSDSKQDGYCFVTFTTEEEAKTATDTLNGSTHNGITLTCTLSYRNPVHRADQSVNGGDSNASRSQFFSRRPPATNGPPRRNNPDGSVNGTSVTADTNVHQTPASQSKADSSNNSGDQLNDRSHGHGSMQGYSRPSSTGPTPVQAEVSPPGVAQYGFHPAPTAMPPAAIAGNFNPQQGPYPGHVNEGFAHQGLPLPMPVPGMNMHPAPWQTVQYAPIPANYPMQNPDMFMHAIPPHGVMHPMAFPPHSQGMSVNGTTAANNYNNNINNHERNGGHQSRPMHNQPHQPGRQSQQQHPQQQQPPHNYSQAYPPQHQPHRQSEMNQQQHQLQHRRY